MCSPFDALGRYDEPMTAEDAYAPISPNGSGGGHNQKAERDAIRGFDDMTL